MTSLRTDWLLATLVAAASLAVVARPVGAEQAPTPVVLDLHDDDRVVLVGDAFFERAYHFGLIETALVLAHPDKHLTFRSLGWSGDTVWGEARAYFGEPADGYAELLKNVDLAGPTVVFVAYGGNESFGGAPGLPAFVEQYGVLLDDLTKRTPRVVLVTPLPHEPASSPLPTDLLAQRNRDLTEYAAAIRELAETRGLATIDLFTAMQSAIDQAGQPIFQNGMHLTEAGYMAAAEQIATRTLSGASTDAFFRRWHGTPTRPDQPIMPADQAWASLRELIIEKNDAFFHRWRPANAQYLYLARRGQQSRNAQEIPMFDPVVAEKEEAIARLLAALTAATSSEGQR